MTEMKVDLGEAPPIGSSDQEPNIKPICFGLGFNITYAKSFKGICKIAEIALAFFGFICVASHPSDCGIVYGGGYGFYEFAAITAVIFTSVLYVMFGFSFYLKITFIDWVLTEMIWCLIDVATLLIASIVVAAQSCNNGGIQAGAAFGFFAAGVFAFNAFLCFTDWREARAGASHSAQASMPSQPVPET